MQVTAIGDTVPEHVIAVVGEDGELTTFDSHHDFVVSMYDAAAAGDDTGAMSAGDYEQVGVLGDREAYALRYRLASSLIKKANAYPFEQIMAMDEASQFALSNDGLRPVVELDVWDHPDHPLYLEATFHAPYDEDVPLPEAADGSDVFAIDAFDEESLTTSVLDAEIVTGVDIEAGQVWDGRED